MEIKTFTYKEGDIEVEVPFTNDGEAYINATEVYKKFGKSQQSFSWWKDHTLVPYANLLIKLGKVQKQGKLVSVENQVVTLDDVVVTVKGAFQEHEQGTWFHPKLAIVFARWLSPEFEIWCDEQIAELLKKGSLPEPETTNGKVDLEIARTVKNVVSTYRNGADDLKKHLATSDRRFTKKAVVLVEVIVDNYACKQFPSILTELSAACKVSEREAMYRRIQDAIDILYEVKKTIDRPTYDYLTEVVNVRRSALISGRLTREVTKNMELQAKYDAISKSEAQLRADIVILEKKAEGNTSMDLQNQLLAKDAELRKTIAEKEALHDSIGFIPENADSVKLNNLVGQTTRAAVSSIYPSLNKAGYDVYFAQGVIPNKFKCTTDNLPTFIGKSMSTPYEAALWPHADTDDYYLVVTKPLIGPDGTNLKQNMVCFKDTLLNIGGGCYGRINACGNTAAVYHAPTKALVVYGNVGQKQA